MSLSAEQARFNTLHATLPKEMNEIKEILAKMEHRLATTEGGVDHLSQKLGEDFQRHEENTGIRMHTLSTEIYGHMSNHYAQKTPDLSPDKGLPRPSVEKDYAPILKLRQPEHFSEKASTCNSFFSQLSLFFAAQVDRFDTNEKKILFAISYLSGTAFAYMEPYLPKLD